MLWNLAEEMRGKTGSPVEVDSTVGGWFWLELTFKVTKGAWQVADQLRGNRWLEGVEKAENWRGREAMWQVYQGVYNVLFSDESQFSRRGSRAGISSRKSSQILSLQITDEFHRLETDRYVVNVEVGEK